MTKIMSFMLLCRISRQYRIHHILCILKRNKKTKEKRTNKTKARQGMARQYMEEDRGEVRDEDKGSEVKKEFPCCVYLFMNMLRSNNDSCLVHSLIWPALQQLPMITLYHPIRTIMWTVSLSLSGQTR